MTELPNSIEAKAAPFLRRIESLYADMESAKGVYMAEYKIRRGEINDVLTAADDAGVPKKALRGLVKYRQLARKQNAISDGLEDIDERAAYDRLLEALGDFVTTELGQAAVERATRAA